jgi:cytochrome b
MNSEKVFVWDLPTRLFHWSLATSFVVTFVTQESEHWRNIHVMAGYVMAGLIAFRLLWGFIGSQHSRFADFWPTLENLKTYLGSLLTRHPKHYVGHNPAGALAIFALLGLGVAASGSGWSTFQSRFESERTVLTLNRKTKKRFSFWRGCGYVGRSPSGELSTYP